MGGHGHDHDCSPRDVGGRCYDRGRGRDCSLRDVHVLVLPSAVVAAAFGVGALPELAIAEGTVQVSSRVWRPLAQAAVVACLRILRASSPVSQLQRPAAAAWLRSVPALAEGRPW